MEEMGKTVARFVTNPFGGVDLYLFRRNGEQIALASVTDGFLNWSASRDLGYVDQKEATLRLHKFDTYGILSALSKGLAEMGVQPDSESKLKGKAEQLEKENEYLRALVSTLIGK